MGFFSTFGVHSEADFDKLHEVMSLGVASYEQNMPPAPWTTLTGADIGFEAGETWATYEGETYNAGAGWFYGPDARVYRSGSEITISFRGTEQNADFANYPNLIDESIIDAYKPLLDSLQSYILSEGITSINVSGHSLGASVANSLRTVSDSINDGVFQDAYFATLATPNSTEKEYSEIINFGFENDMVFKIVDEVAEYGEGYSDLPSTTDNVVFYNFIFGEQSGGIRGGSSAHYTQNYLYSLDRIWNSDYYDLMNEDSVVIVADGIEGERNGGAISEFYSLEKFDSKYFFQDQFFLGRQWDSDIYHGGSGIDFIEGLGGADLLRGGGSGDVIKGGDEDDSQGEHGDYLFGGGGADEIFGGAGDDLIDGGDFFADFGTEEIPIPGDRSTDVLTGGEGNDIFFAYGECGNDVITDFCEDDAFIFDMRGDRGVTTTPSVSFSGGDSVLDLGHSQLTFTGVQIDQQDIIVESAWVVIGSSNIFAWDVEQRILDESLIEISTPTGVPVFDTNGNVVSYEDDPNGSGDEYVWGTESADKILGTSGADVIFGNAGADVIFGNNGSDIIHAGIDGDVIVGGKGNDILHGSSSGGSGPLAIADGSQDTFLFEVGDGSDVVHGFEVGPNNEVIDRLVFDLGMEDIIDFIVTPAEPFDRSYFNYKQVDGGTHFWINDPSNPGGDHLNDVYVSGAYLDFDHFMFV